VGLQAVYAFKDVSKLTLELSPHMPSGMGGKKEKKEHMSFKLARKSDGTSLLTVLLPPPQKKDETKPADTAPKKDPTTNELAMMKTIFNGMKISLEVEPQGTVISTTSPYVEGNDITLMAIDFGLIIQNTDKFKAFAKNQNPGFAEMNRICKDIPGMKIPPSNEISIVFSSDKALKTGDQKKK
jgi:hypothetical protein